MEGNRMQDVAWAESPVPEATEGGSTPSPAVPESERTTPMLDVHAPHEPIRGWKDFLLHLFTIMVGLLIALGLEGLVE
jgi:hypothetical protein